MNKLHNEFSGGRVFTPNGMFVAPLAADVLATLLDRMSEHRVRAALESGQIAASNHAQVLEWLAIKESEREADAAEVTLRGIEASERAADAAEKSARWAIFAAVISTVALLISALPYISK